MSTISKMPENKVARTPNNRTASLLVVVALIVIAIGLMTVHMKPIGSTSVRVVESNEQAQREYKLGERYGVLPAHNGSLSPEQIQREYILGERYGVTPEKYTLEQALREFWLGERYGVTPQEYAREQALREYWMGERYGQLPPDSGLGASVNMTPYLLSERTSIPVQFTPYQLSEWFGQ